MNYINNDVLMIMFKFVLKKFTAIIQLITIPHKFYIVFHIHENLGFISSYFIISHFSHNYE